MKNPCFQTRIGSVKWTEFKGLFDKMEKMQMRNKIKLTIMLTALFWAGSCNAIHPAQFSNQISAMLNEASLYPALEVELDFMFDRKTMRTTQHKLQQVRLARKHGVSELAENARKMLMSARRHYREAYWIADDAVQAGEDETLAEAIAPLKEKKEALEELKTSFLDLVDQWNKLEKEWTLMRNNDLAKFAERAFFKMVRRHVYEPENHKDPRLVPVLIDDLNYYISEINRYLGYLKNKINTL